jgi:hypothetical protein
MTRQARTTDQITDAKRCCLLDDAHYRINGRHGASDGFDKEYTARFAGDPRTGSAKCNKM